MPNPGADGVVDATSAHGRDTAPTSGRERALGHLLDREPERQRAHAGVHAAEVAQGLERMGFEIVSQVIWDKGLFAIGRSWYHWSHELCWVVRRKGAKVRFSGTRDQATIWRVPSPKMIMGGSTERKEDHPAQKPLLLFETPVRNHLKPGESLYDPFLGSGAAIIAAERHCARSYGLELDPVYVDVILRRFERFSGQTAVRLEC